MSPPVGDDRELGPLTATYVLLLATAGPIAARLAARLAPRVLPPATAARD